MKHYTAFLIGIILCLASCTTPSKHEEILMQVESFIHEGPDSALTILQGIDTTTLKNKEEKAKHALL